MRSHAPILSWILRGISVAESLGSAFIAQGGMETEEKILLQTYKQLSPPNKWDLLQWASPMAQWGKNPSAKETRVQSLGREDPMEKEVATLSSAFPWRVPWTEETGGLQSTGSQRVWRRLSVWTHTVWWVLVSPTAPWGTSLEIRSPFATDQVNPGKKESTQILHKLPLQTYLFVMTTYSILTVEKVLNGIYLQTQTHTCTHTK